MNDIKEIATEIREKCERFAKSPLSENRDYHGCSKLSCMCAVASIVLSKALKLNKIKNKVINGLYGGETHCWVELENGKIIDITATQFNIKRKVLIISNKNKLFQNYKKESIATYKLLKGWGFHQAPSPKLTKIILDIP